MRIINASFDILNLDNPSDIYKAIERAGRTCYKSESNITDESAEKFVRNIIRHGHEAMLEHASMTVRFIVDRGISHELVRHRIASFAQESTRYCNYSKDKFGNEITVIEPCFFKHISDERKEEIKLLTTIYGNELKTNLEAQYYFWFDACTNAENQYFLMIKAGATAQEARAVLPNSLKTEVIMTANMREWRHFLKLRASGSTGMPHPQMLEVAIPLLNELREKLPAIFEDITPLEV